MNTDNSTEPKPSNIETYAKTAEDLLRWNIICAYDDVAKAKSLCKMYQMRNRSPPAFQLMSAVMKLYTYVRQMMAMKSKNKTQIIDRLLEVTTNNDQKMKAALKSFEYIDKFLYDSKITRLDRFQQLDRSRMYLGNDADG